MSFLTKPKKVKIVQTKGSRSAQDWLMNAMGSDVSAPLQGTAGLTPFQNQVMQAAQGSLPQAQKYYEAAGKQLMDTASGHYDPYTSPYYSALRQEGERAKEAASTQARQRSQMGGALYSTPAVSAESQARTGVESVLQRELARLYESERGRQTNAANALPGLASSQMRGYGQMASVGDAQRQVEQQQFNAIYNQALQNVLAPYKYQAQLASALYSPQYAAVGGGQSDLGASLSMAGPVAQAIIASDIRLKTDITEVPGEINVPGCKWYKWKWNKIANKLGYIGNGYGLIAQEVKKRYPEYVVERDGYLAILYSNLLKDIISKKAG